MRLRKVIHVIILFLSAVLLPGCWDYKPIESMLYPSAIGVDYKDNRYEVYVQMLSFKNIAKSESAGGGGPDTPKLYVGKGSGKTVALAINNLYDTSQRRIFWSHVRSYLFTEEALQAGGSEYFDTLKRYKELRYTPWIYVTKGSIEDIYKIQSFFMMSPNTNILNEPQENYRQKSFIHPLVAYEYQQSLNEPGKTTVIPSLIINKTAWQSEKKDDPKLKINGGAIIQQKTVYGWMPESQLIGLRWMENSTERTPLEVKSAIVSLEKPKPQIKIMSRGGEISFNIEVKVTGNIVELLEQGSTDQEIEEEVESQIAKEIRTTYTNGLKLGADIYSFKNELFKKRYKNWNEIPLIASTLNQVTVDVHINNNGQTVIN